MRLLHAMLLLLPLFAAPAFAQTVTDPTTEHHGRRSAEQHFTDANTTHDGHLTLDQATTGYKSLARSFHQIDVNHRGYITMDDIKAWRAAKKAARLAAKRAAEQTPDARQTKDPNASGTSNNKAIPIQMLSPRTGVDLPTAPLDKGRAS